MEFNCSPNLSNTGTPKKRYEFLHQNEIKNSIWNNKKIKQSSSNSRVFLLRFHQYHSKSLTTTKKQSFEDGQPDFHTTHSVYLWDIISFMTWFLVFLPIYLIIMIVTVINMSSSYQHGMTTLISSGVSYTEKIVNHWAERERLMNGAHHIDEFVKFMNYAIRSGREKLHWLIVTWHCGIFLENNKIYWKCHINLTKNRSYIWVNDR